MKLNCYKIIQFFRTIPGLFLFLLTGILTYGQPVPGKHALLKAFSQDKSGLFGDNNSFIENIGQYGDKSPAYAQMGKILYGYEGLGMPVLFTQKGLIHLQRKTKLLSREEIENEERRKNKSDGVSKKQENIDQVITMEWVNANPNPVILLEGENSAYHTYGMLPGKARSYKKLIYKDLYPGVDVEYCFMPGQDRPGFEYRILVKPGADINLVKLKYGGDIRSIGQDKKGNLVVRSSIEGINESAPFIYYEGATDDTLGVSFSIEKNTVHFKFSAGYDKGRELVIDPFISNTGTLTGANTGKAKDIDFDYAGNIYVSGGGDNSFQKLAKFDPSGVLLWTFSGSLGVPNWVFGNSYGGWVVEKTTGKVYLGQGLSAAGGGFSVIRLTTAGIYDNYITTPNSSFGEDWKMIYSCHNGSATILVAGGGGSANNELALLSPPSVIPAASNISGLAGGHNDISDIVIDPLTDEMYTIFSTSINTPGADCRIYKHLPPYTAGTLTWSVLTGFFALREPANRPYMQGLDNSSNTLAVNSSYLFYTDGRNLEAINKTTGAITGTPFILPNTAMQQGGIYADECNNVFVGSNNGTIVVLKFNGSTFDDAAAPDINITGVAGDAVYDLAYDNSKKFLYASGKGFVASFDISSYCPATTYAVSTLTDCTSLSATATVTPTPPIGTTITYSLYDGVTLISSNATGIFTGLTVGINYTVKAFMNQACGGTQAIGNFIVTTTPSLLTHSPATFCPPATADLTDPSVTAGSTAGLTFTYWMDAAASVPYSTPATATAGTYYIKGTTVSGCSSITPVNVTAFTPPIANAGADKTVCFGNDTQLQGSGGVIYFWSPSTWLDNPSLQNPMMIHPANGTIIYHLMVTDNNGCLSLIDDQVTVTVSASAKITLSFDTTIAINQPLQLNPIDANNSGLTNWSWTPTYGLNNPFIQNPIAILDKDISYSVTGSTAGNCIGTTVIHVKVYNGPEIYVPSAFTPGNRDGLNDVLKAIPAGIQEFHFFSIYNRYGQLVFTTSDPRKGWDGTWQGTEQSSGVYVWMAEALDYKGNIIFRKGTCTIIR